MLSQRLHFGGGPMHPSNLGCGSRFSAIVAACVLLLVLATSNSIAREPAAAAGAKQPPSTSEFPRGALYTLGNDGFRADSDLMNCCFSTDATYLAATDGANTVWIWNAASGKIVKRLTYERQRLSGEGLSVVGAELHCYGQQSAGTGWIHHRWSADRGVALDDLPVSSGERNRLSKRQPPGQRRELVDAPGDKLVVRDFDTGAELLTIPRVSSQTHRCLSPDENLLVLDFWNQQTHTDRLEIWDLRRKEKTREVTAEGALFRLLLVSMDNAILAAAGNELRCWDLRSGKPLPPMKSAGRVFGSIAFSPNGSQIAAIFRDHTDLYEVASGKRIWSLSTPGDCHQLQFSPNGRLLAAGGGQSVIWVFDLTTGKLLHSQDGMARSIDDAAFSADGRRLATLDRSGGFLTIWDLASRRPVETTLIADHFRGPALGAENRLSANGQIVIARRSLGMPQTWKPDSGPLPPFTDDTGLSPLVGAGSHGGACFAALPDGSLEMLAFGMPNHRHEVLFQSFPGHPGNVLAVALAADASVGASIGDDDVLQILNLRSPAAAPVKIVLAETPRPVVAVSDDGNRVATVLGKRLTVWKSIGGEATAKIDLGTDRVTALKFSPDGQRIVAGFATGELRLCDLTAGKVLAVQPMHDGPVSAIEFARDGKSLYSSGRDGVVARLEPDTLKKRSTVAEKKGAILSMTAIGTGSEIVFSDDRGLVVAVDPIKSAAPREVHPALPAQVLFGFMEGDGFGMVANVGGRTGIALDANSFLGNGYVQIPHKSLFQEPVAIAPDGKSVLRATPAGIRVWSTAGSQATQQYPATNANLTRALAIGPDGEHFVAAGGGLALWKKVKPNPIWQVPGQETGNVDQLAFSPDNRFLVASHWSGEDRATDDGRRQPNDYLRFEHDFGVWDVATGKRVQTIQLPRQLIGDARFAANGRIILAATKDEFAAPSRSGSRQQLLAWEVASGKQIGSAPLPDIDCTCVALSHNGKMVALGLPNGTAVICDLHDILGPLLEKSDPGDPPSFAELWAKLAADDPLAAYRAIHGFKLRGDAAAKFIAARLAPDKFSDEPPAVEKQPTPDEIQSWIHDLDGEDSRAKEASARLLKMAKVAREPLETALKGAESERVRTRLELILHATQSAGTAPRPLSPMAIIRAVGVLEEIGNPTARSILKKFALGPADAPMTIESIWALKRLGGIR